MEINYIGLDHTEGSFEFELFFNIENERRAYVVDSGLFHSMLRSILDRNKGVMDSVFIFKELNLINYMYFQGIKQEKSNYYLCFGNASYSNRLAINSYEYINIKNNLFSIDNLLKGKYFKSGEDILEHININNM